MCIHLLHCIDRWVDERGEFSFLFSTATQRKFENDDDDRGDKVLKLLTSFLF